MELRLIHCWSWKENGSTGLISLYVWCVCLSLVKKWPTRFGHIRRHWLVSASIHWALIARRSQKRACLHLAELSYTTGRQQQRSSTFLSLLRVCLGRSEPDKIPTMYLESSVSSSTQVGGKQRRCKNCLRVYRQNANNASINAPCVT